MTEHESMICREYGFDRQAFSRFLNDYIVILDGELSPEPEEIVDREFEEVARMVGLPAYVVRRAQEEGTLSDPLTSGDLDSLRFLKKVFGKSWLLRAQLVKSNKAERQSLVRRPELLPWERWAYNRFLSQKIARTGAGNRTLSSGQRLHLSTLLRTIEDVFKVPASEMTKDRLIQIRKMALNDHYAARRSGVELGEMARRRGVELEGEEHP